MKKIFYILDPNGEFYSTDRTKRYRQLTGQALVVYLRGAEAKKKYFEDFIQVLDNKADKVMVAPVFAAWNEFGSPDSQDLAKELSNAELDLSYRHSCIPEKNYIVL